MGLGSTTKKIQMLADTAEKMFHRLNEVREQVETTQTTVQDTGDRVQQLETEIVEQRAILEAIATDLDIDLDAVSADAHINDAEVEATTDSETVDDAETPDQDTTETEA
jgi:septal ring factor EnvC (AmiA/AmiB activator)